MARRSASRPVLMALYRQLMYERMYTVNSKLTLASSSRIPDGLVVDVKTWKRWYWAEVKWISDMGGYRVMSSTVNNWMLSGSGEVIWFDDVRVSRSNRVGEMGIRVYDSSCWLPPFVKQADMMWEYRLVGDLARVPHNRLNGRSHDPGLREGHDQPWGEADTGRQLYMDSAGRAYTREG
jgi:hypothetical protein